MKSEFDVAIIGGGLAGMTLAMQLNREVPDLSIAVLERNGLPPAIAAHKVGESTVEIGAHYLSQKLELKGLLERTQLRKFGLRFFFGSGQHDDLSAADELGASRVLPVISYQIDRGRLEGDLASMLEERSIHILDNCVVKDVVVGSKHGTHQLGVVHADKAVSIRCRWLIDAASRAALLKRKLGTGRRCQHRMAAAWFRLDSAVAIDHWSSSTSWQNRCNLPRRLSTNHLMGSGYWVWIIPLANDRTSIGVVADPELVPLSSFNSFDKFGNWLSEAQPRLADAVSDLRGTLMDFHFSKNLSQDSRRVWSADRWALTGESGVFADPFYSPGSDFIGIGNTFIADLIRRDRAGMDFSVHAAAYEQMYQSFFTSTMTLYEHQYPGFGDTRLMVVKTTWDYAYYWSVLSWLCFREILTDIEFLRSIQPRLLEIRAMNERMQARFRARAAERRSSEGQGRFFDQVEIPVLYRLNAALLDSQPDPRGEFDENCATLESLSPALIAVLEGDGGTASCSLLGDLRTRLN